GSWLYSFLLGFFEHAPEAGEFTKKSEIRRTSRARRTRVLTADFAHAVISIRAGTVGADGKRNKPSVDEIGFCGCQLARTPANQHSVLVIHLFLLSRCRFLHGPKSLQDEKCGSAYRRSRLQLALPDRSVSVGDAPSGIPGAWCIGRETSAD